MTPKDEGPQDPLTPLVQAASAVHEMFRAYQQAGFSPKEALYLCGQWVREAAAGGNSGEDAEE